MSKSFENHIKNSLLIILSIALIVIYFQNEKINDLKIINNQLSRKADDAFMYIFTTSNRSAGLADSLESLSYIKSDAHYNEYKDLFKKADNDLKKWKAEINQLVSLGVDNDISDNPYRYHSTDIDNVVTMYRFNNISPTDFSQEWRLTLQETAKRLRAFDEEIKSIKNRDLFYLQRKGVIKRMVVAVLKKHLDEIYRINNAEYERLQKQIKSLLK